MDCCISHHPQVCVCSLSRSVTSGSPQGSLVALRTRSSAEVLPWLLCSLPLKGLCFHPWDKHRMQCCPTLAPHDTGSVHYLRLMFSMIKFTFGAGTEPCSRNRKCEQQCCLWAPLLSAFPQSFSHASSPHISHESLTVCAMEPWCRFFSFPGDNSVRKE